MFWSIALQWKCELKLFTFNLVSRFFSFFFFLPLSLFLALERRETGRGVGRVRGERSWKRGYFFSLLTLQSVELWSNQIKVITPFSDWEPGMGEFSGTATF